MRLNSLLWWKRKPARAARVSRNPGRRLRVESLESRDLLTVLPAGFQESTVFSGGEPTGMDFAPDGRLFVANKSGTITIIEANGQPAPSPFFSVAVDTYRDRGLTSFCFDPNFAQNHYLYVYYTPAIATNPDVASNGAVNRLIRLTADSSNPDVADPSSAVTILDNIPSPDGIHTGGFLHFGIDGMLYIGIGELDTPSNAQDLSNIYGKVLRLDVHNYPNIIPSDNPFVNQAGARPEIWAYGFRNPFSGGVNSSTGDIFVNDVGSTLWEEVDKVVKGGNYGWPNAEGTSSNSSYVNPLYTYSHNGQGACVVGGAFDTFNSFPASYNGQYFAADLVQGVMHTIDPATGNATPFETGMVLPTSMLFGPDGNLYWSSLANGAAAIYKISYVGAADRAPIAAAKADVTSGPLPLTVNFDGTGSSDPDNDSLTYSWDFGDGTTGTGATVQHVYNTAGKYNAVLTVSDRPSGGLTNTAAAILIAAGDHAPVPAINTPLATDKYVAGQTIKFSGSATDAEDGTLPASAYHWSFLFGHNTHFHDFIGPIDGVTSGSFVVPLTGETDPDQYYRIFLTITDSVGVSTTTYRDIRPVTSTFTLASNIAGAELLLDSQPKAAGTTTTGVVGMTRSIEAPQMQLINGRMYKFVSWSDGGAAKHNIATPSSPKTYTAKYQAMPLAATYSSNAPSQVVAGQKVNYQVTVTNVGTQSWSAGGTNRVRLGVYFGGTNDAAGAWSVEPARFSLPKNVGPGQSITFNVQVTAPSKAGTYILRDRMVKEYVAWFDTMEKINATVGTLQANYAGTPPTIWGTGQPQHDLVVVTNTGTLTWKASGPDRVRMGVYFGTSDTPPTAAGAIQYFNLPFDVAPGQSAPVLVDVFGPASAGHMTIYHRLIQDQAGWFSDMYRTPAWVQVLSAQYDVAPPTQWTSEQVQTYQITLTNTGSDTWDSTGPNAVHLGVYFGGDSDDAGAWPEEPTRFSLPYDVAPGQSVTLTVSIAAPPTPGNYVLRQRMVKEFVNWFVPLSKTNVTVS